ncbi:hypothetical protein VN97_g219 [Penicillium thymicola]|uniref:Uncharacterized protein n=1 Tax=Penicillium thymicola TaxID=293382 RepID=A0AAI9TT95_PENTH|nr:hypothetical protein VN97_g219 [Penicillium thymicola]
MVAGKMNCSQSIETRTKLLLLGRAQFYLVIKKRQEVCTKTERARSRVPGSIRPQHSVSFTKESGPSIPRRQI